MVVLAGGLAHAQHGKTFAYTGIDSEPEALHTGRVWGGGFTNSFYMEYGYIEWAFVPSVYARVDQLLFRPDAPVNLSVGLAPEVMIYPWFMGRATLSTDVLFGNEANVLSGRDYGARIGVGYSAFGSSFGFHGHYPVAQVGIRIKRFRIMYAKALAGNGYRGGGRYDWRGEPTLDHHFSVGVAMDF